jgi:hypothetical protein
VTARLVVRPEAATELREAREWFDAQRPGLGNEFVSEVDLTISGLARPESFLQVHGPTRRAIVHRFPYGVFFSKCPDAIVILDRLRASRSTDLAAATVSADD